MRRVAFLILAAALIAACGRPEGSPEVSAEAAGILFVTVGEQVQARPQTEELASAFSKAIELADAFGGDLGYPWIDPSTSELVLSVVTQRGRDAVEAAGIVVPHRIRTVSHGAVELEQIQHEATFLNGQGVPGAELIYETLPDHRDNRTLLVIRAMSEPLLEALAARFPVDALAVEVNPDGR